MRSRAFRILLAVLFAAGPVLCDEADTPLTNWAAPPYWVPPGPSGPAGELPRESVKFGGEARALTTAPLPFFAVEPCRVLDTRGNGFTGEWGPPSLAATFTRSFTIAGRCGIPATAQAVSFQFTAVNMTSRGNLRAWPGGSAMPTATVLNWLATTGIAGNGTVVPIGGGGVLSVYLNAQGGNFVDLFVDVNGYYAPEGVVNTVNGLSGDVTLSAGTNVTITPSGQTLTINSSGGPGGVLPLGSGDQTLRSNGTSWVASSILTNTGSAIGITGPLTVTNSSGHGVYGTTTGASNAGVRGYNNDFNGYGVWGETGSGTGVYGLAPFGIGVYGQSSSAAPMAGVWGNNLASGYGVYGYAGGGTGVFGQSATSGKAGVQGVNYDAGGYGVWGGSTSGTGVYGSAAAASRAGVWGVNHTAGGFGVWGNSDNGLGVHGYSQNYVGVSGASTNGTGVWGTALATGKAGVKGVNDTAGGYGVRGDSTSGTGVYGSSVGGQGVVGTATGTDMAGVYGRNDNSTGVGVQGYSTSGNGVWGISTSGFGVLGSSTSFSGVYGSSATTAGVYGKTNAATSAGVWGDAASSGGQGVVGTASATAKAGVQGVNNTAGGYGVWGDSTNGTGVYGVSVGGYGVQGTSTSSRGVYGKSTNEAGVLGETSSANSAGVWGYSTAGHGVFGTASAAGKAAIYGENPGGLGYAGDFQGNVRVTGALTKGSGSFKIDHPLDPENRYLYHSFVESPDMMNIYNGNVTTDGRGYATVELPEWFEALNRDFRYQLTVVDEEDGDGFVQAKIVRGVASNSFRIRTSCPNARISWQVTGIRKDAFAERNRIPVEEMKPDGLRGRYLHPEAFGRE